MSSNPNNARNSQLSPFAWLQHLSINLKLLIPVALAFVVVLGAFFFLLAPGFNGFIEDNVRLGFNSHLNRLDERMTDFFERSRRSLTNLATSAEVQRYTRAQEMNYTVAIGVAKTSLEDLLTATLVINEIPLTDLRFLSPEGREIVKVELTSYLPGMPILTVPEEQLESENSSIHYLTIRGLKEGEFYMSPPTLAESPVAGGEGLGLELQVGAPVYADHEYAGVIIGTLRPRNYLVNVFQASEFDIFTFTTVLYDSNGTLALVADPAAAQKVAVRGDSAFETVAVPEQVLSGPEQELTTVDDRTYSAFSFSKLASQGFTGAGWRIITSKALSDAPITGINEIGNIAISRSVLVLLGAVIFIGLISQAVVRPLRRVSQAARRMAAGDLQTRIPVTSQDEIGQLAAVLNDMSARLYDLVTSLESRVSERTRNIQIAADIGREAAHLRDINQLLQHTVDAIRDRFNFYHAQVFLVDDAREYAVLVTSTGEQGRELLARKHKLAVGSHSIVGQVTAQRRTFITLDTQQSEVPHRFNPFLPLTRSEMALPLIVGNQVLGALDIQSVEPDAFDEDDVQIFQLLADQIAIAIDNAHLIGEQQQRVEQINDLNRQLTASAWSEYVEEQTPGELAYKYDLVEVVSVEPTKDGKGGKDSKDGGDGSPGGSNSMETRITVRGEPIGSLSVASSETAPLSSEDRAVVQAVAERVALAVENIRLVEQTQGALKRVEQLYTASRALGRTVNIADIYRIAAEQVALFSFVDRLMILLARPHPSPDAPHFENVFTWDRVPAEEGTGQPISRLPREAIPARWLSVESQTPYLADLETELDEYPATRRVFEMFGAQSLIIVPLATPQRWFGAMLCQSKQPNVFSRTFVQFVGAIADQVSIALDNRYLFGEVQAEARRSRALAEAAKVASQIGVDFETGITILILTVASSADYDRWWFGQVNLAVRGVVLDRLAGHFEPDSPLENMTSITLEMDQGAIAEATRIGDVVVVNNPASHPLLRSLPPEAANAYGKHLAVPVRVGTNTVGTLMLGRDVNQADLNDRDVELALTLASQMSIAFENRRLFDAAESGREVLQSVLNSLPTGVMVVDAASEQVTLSNEQARAVLGLDELVPYALVQTSTNETYTDEDLPIARVLRTQAMVLAEDITAIDAQGERRDLLVNAAPIFREGKLFGAVAVYQDVTELRELENVLQESLRETTTLYEISRTIAAEHELTSILSVVGLQIHNLLAPDHLLAIFSDEQGEPVQVYRVNVEGEQARIALLESGCPIPVSLLSLDSVFTDSNIPENPALAEDGQLKALGIVSLSILPLSARSRNVGWLVVGFHSSRTFTPEERRTMSNIADQAAVAAESARLAEQTSLALRTTTLLYEASLNINRAESIVTTLEVVRDLLRSFAPTQIDVFLSDTQSDESRTDWAVHWNADDPATQGEVSLDNCPRFDNPVFLEADPIYVDNVTAVDRATRAIVRAMPGWEKFAAHASVPLAVKGRVMGRVVVSFTRPFQFGRSEQQIIRTLADQAAVAIDNFLLVQQTQESLDETAVLYQSSQAIGAAADMTEQLKAIIDYAIQPMVSGALLIRLMSGDWAAPDASIEIMASWQREAEGIDLTGIRFTPEQFPAWSEISARQLLWLEDLQDVTHPVIGDESIYHIFGFRSVIVFPLSSAGNPVGTLLFGADEPWPYTDREVRIYTSLAELLAISMERQRLLEQTEHRARQLQLSAQIAQAATSILDLDELFNRTVDLIKTGFGYDHVQVFRISADNTDAKVVASTGEIGRQLLAIGHHLPVGSRSVIGQVTSTGAAHIVSDTTDRRSVHRPNPYLPRTRAEMALPLVARSRILGALDVQSNEPGAFTRDDVNVLSTLADQVAIAIDNAELFETSNRRAEEMRFLFDVTHAATVIADDPDTALRKVAQLVQENLGAVTVSLLLLDESATRLIPYTAARPEAIISPPPFYDFNSPFFKAFAESKEPMTVNDVQAVMQIVQTSPKLGQLRLLQQLQGLVADAQSILLVPLLSGDNFVGILGAVKQEREGFNDDSLRLVQTLSSTLSAIIQNARLLREVQAANIRLLELDKVKNQFLANMSHELRTPLNSIIGFSRVILKGIDGPLTEMQEQDLTTIYESGKHLLGLVNDILDQAKIEADKMEFSAAHFSIVEMIRGVMSTAVGLVKDKPIHLHQEIEADLPFVWGDEFRTRQALLNLVSNAAKFTQQGSITTAAFRIEEAGQLMVQVSVTDTGIGVPQDRLDAIFEPFQQVENSAARQYEGTGLGLPIARKLIEKQGGRIWVVSEPGVGSTFSFTMPINPAEASSEGASQEETQPAK